MTASREDQDVPDPDSESPHVNATVTDGEPQRSTSVGSDAEGRHVDPTIPNMRLVQEIKTIQQRLWGLEREARPKLIREDLKAEWERERDELGPEEERKAWREEKRRRKAGTMAANPLQYDPDKA